MKQIFLKVYPNGKTTTNASVLNFDRENKSGEIVIDYSEVSYLDWDKQLDLIFSDGSTAFVTGSGNTLTVPLLESYLKKGSMTVQPIAKRLVGSEYEKAKWQVVALSVRDSLNVLENDPSITPSVAEQWDIRIKSVEDADVIRQENEDERIAQELIRESSELLRIENEIARNTFVPYSGSTAYLAGNKVSYLGSSYVAKSNTTGNLPTNTTYWLLIASKGEQGVPGEVSLVQLNAGLALKSDKLEVDAKLLNKHSITNRITNGNFVDLTGWSSMVAYGRNAVVTVANNTLSIKGNTTTSAGARYSNGTFELGKTYHVKVKLRVTNSDCSLIVVKQGDVKNITTITNPAQNAWYELDANITIDNVVHTFICFFHVYSSVALALDKVMEVQYVSVVELSNELLNVSSDNLAIAFNKFANGYINGTVDLFIDPSEINRKIKPTSNLMGKKWLCIGDSLTEINARTSKNYHSFISDWVNGMTIINNGIGGTGYFEGSSPIYNRISGLTSDADIVTVFAGTNDWGETTKPLVLGSLGDTDGAVSLYGAIDNTLSQIIAKYPENTIAVITPTPRSDAAFDIANASGITMTQVNNAIKQVCEKYGVPYLDLYKNSGLFPFNSNNNAKYFSSTSSRNGDGLHPNFYGHQKIAYQILDFLTKLVGSN